LTRYAVAVEDKQYKIDITKTGNEEHFAVKIDDKPHEAELVKTKFDYETPLQIRIGEKTYTVQINKTGKQASFLVKITDIPFTAEVKTQLPLPAIKATETLTPILMNMKSPAGKTAIEGAITAPMAGKIVSLKVKKGDSVKVGAVLCILEAMKMENEIAAPTAGTVQEINVSEGATINEGEILIIIK